MSHASRFALCSALLVASRLPAQAPPTIEQLLSAPFASDLVAGPDGKIAWVEIVLGARNIWVAEPPSYRGRQVTHYTADDGRRMTQLAFTRDGSSMLFVRGGNQRGTRLPDPPNPLLSVEGGKEEVWIVTRRAAGGVGGGAGEAMRVDDGISPVVSPRGDLVAYLKKDQIWAAPLTRTATGVVVGRPRQLVNDRGPSSMLRWSPSANRLAFVSNREQHSFIGVYDADANTLRFLDPSTDRDQEPTWSPDGREIAFIRIPSNPPTEAGGRGRGRGGAQPGRRSTLPWSIRVADVATGRGREAWRAMAGMGGTFWNFLANDRQLFWTADNRIAFPWERTGWVHLYAVPSAGGSAVSLTSGEFEVEHVALTADRRELVFSSNEGDIDRRHLWRVSPGGGPARAVTTGTESEYWPVPASDGRALAFQSSGVRQPPHVEVVRMADVTAGAARPAARQTLAAEIAPRQFPASRLVEQQQVVFPSLDGLQIHGQLFLPPSYDSRQRYPAILYFHGGPNSQQLLGYNYIQVDYYQKHYALNQYLAHHGYIVLSVNYRRSTGYGMKFREPEPNASGDPRQDPDAIDVIGAARYLRGRTDVDTARVGLWGGSAGGQRVILGLSLAPELFAAGVDIHGVATQSLGKTQAWKAPVLIIHADDDRNVAFTQSVQLAAELRQRGVEVEELVIPNDEHSFLLHSNWVTAFKAAIDFFDRKLKAQP